MIWLSYSTPLRRDGQNPILAVAIPNLVAAEENLRLVLMRLRLLRCAVACHLGEGAPALDDPLGSGPLVRKQIGPVVHFQSVGTRRQHSVARAVAVE